MRQALTFLSTSAILLNAIPASAHRVYFEPQAKVEAPSATPASQDYSFENPGILDNIWGSKAIFGHLTSGDVDVYSFTVGADEPVSRRTLIAMAMSPACSETRDDYVHIAVVGPNLSAPVQSLPFAVPPGYGVVVKENPVVAKGVDRATFHETTANISWFLPSGLTQSCIEDRNGPPMSTCEMSSIFSQPFFTTDMPHYIVVWADGDKAQDYTLSVGVVDSGYYVRTPDEHLTHNNAHLHGACTPLGPVH